MSDCKTQREVSSYYNYKDLINYRKKGLDMLSELDKPVVDDTIGIDEKDLDDEDIEASGYKIIGQEAETETPDLKKVVAKLSKVYPKDTEAPAGGVDDMKKPYYLHEPGVLQNIRSKYELNEIDTYTDNILIAINLFQKLPHSYDSHMMDEYKGAPFVELSPHVFVVADVSYRSFLFYE
ncbi:unnamed protein product [Lactuca virosa]|uniref:Myosin motor domain-containing protein n=1 Tax=Lactuca virosa TaxID=75947 RepID=A0AAU9PSW5_9ASTR|nr:unnamed protein product [Lactuca virosa]